MMVCLYDATGCCYWFQPLLQLHQFCFTQEACSLAKRCLRRARQRGASRHSAARIAATVLTRAAVDRGSRDNVTVVVVDLSRSISSPVVALVGSALLPHSGQWLSACRLSDCLCMGTYIRISSSACVHGLVSWASLDETCQHSSFSCPVNMQRLVLFSHMLQPGNCVSDIADTGLSPLQGRTGRGGGGGGA
jgi:hypothetical protein